jgi:hypothetical protein
MASFKWYGKCVMMTKVLNTFIRNTILTLSEPCTHTDIDPYRWLGETFTLDNAECVCTQDYNVNNKPFNKKGSLFDTPSLCSQDGGKERII